MLGESVAGCQEVISKCSGEDQDDRELEEGFVGFGFAFAAGGDAGTVAQPGIGALDRPAVFGLRVARFEPAFLAAPYLAGGCAGGDRLPGFASFADPRRDPPLTKLVFERGRVVAAVGPQLAGLDAARGKRVKQR